MNIKIGVIGANGRLGKAIASMTPIVPILRGSCIKSIDCDVLIDVSSPAALKNNLAIQKPIVIGTTGHADLSPIIEASKHLPIFYAPNFSLGMAVMKKVAIEIAKLFPSDIDIIETHHKEKKDAPSGSALMLQKELPSSHIHSIRSGKIIGEHSLIFNNAQEQITLTHTAHSREAFAYGALMAARFLIRKPNGLYSMDNLF